MPAPWEVAADPQPEAAGVLAEIHPGLKTIQNPIQVEGVEKVPPRMASEVGEHTREILRELDFGDREIGALIERGAVFIKEKA